MLYLRVLLCQKKFLMQQDGLNGAYANVNVALQIADIFGLQMGNETRTLVIGPGYGTELRIILDHGIPSDWRLIPTKPLFPPLFVSELCQRKDIFRLPPKST